MFSHIAFLSLPLLVAGARHGHNHARAHHKGLEQRSDETAVVTVTHTVTVTEIVLASSSCTETSRTSVALLTSSSNTPVVPPHSVPLKQATNVSQLPAKQTPLPGKSVDHDADGFSTLSPVANLATVKNSCAYDVYIWSVGDPSCDGTPAPAKLLEANGTYTEPLRKCTKGGISLKISKTTDASKPMQFEYAVWQTDPSKVSYDISYLDCMKNKNKNNEQDLSECPGHDSGIQAMGGGDGQTYTCASGKWCDKHAYVVEEFANKPGAPVGTCGVEHGVAFELCGEFA